jgi:hypothetical protein
MLCTSHLMKLLSWRPKFLRHEVGNNRVVNCPAHWVLSLGRFWCHEEQRRMGLKGGWPKPVLSHSLHLQFIFSTFLCLSHLELNRHNPKLKVILYYILMKISYSPFSLTHSFQDSLTMLSSLASSDPLVSTSCIGGTTGEHHCAQLSLFF